MFWNQSRNLSKQPKLIMPQRPHRIDARGASGGIERGDDRDDQGKQDCAEGQIERQQKEIDEGSTLRLQNEPIGQPIRHAVDAPREQSSDYAASNSKDRRFDEE